jgi:nucleoside-diphosphate-sugar epimerase
MRILVTGGTGFVGSHTVRAILDAGHEVRLLARDASRVGRALQPLGVAEVATAIGDVTDAAAVKSALAGCDAVFHCASVYSHDSRRAKEIAATNLAGAKAVLGQAVEMGLDPVVHVSSIVSLLPARGRLLREDSPVGAGGPSYSVSKQEQERYARSLQETGAPVVITYPGGVWGPNDPYDGESTLYARNFTRGLTPFLPSGGLPVVDVRDLATAQARVFEAGKGPRRYMLGGQYVRIRELAGMVQGEAGVRRPRVPVPAAAAHFSAVAAGAIQRIAPFRLPIDPGSTWVIRCNATADNSLAEQELGVSFRPVAETIRDQVAWQKAAGRL